MRMAYNAAFGVNIFYKQNGLRPAIRNPKNGEDLIMFVDQKESSSNAILVRFFDKITATIPLVPALSLKYNIPQRALIINWTVWRIGMVKLNLNAARENKLTKIAIPHIAPPNSAQE
jgi:lauroyl/myristoyl acyltransferase